MSAGMGKTAFIFLNSFLFLLTFSLCRAEDSFFVSLHGDDKNPGTRERPFATISKAKQAAGQLHRPVTIYLREGTYIFRGTLAFDEQDRDITLMPWQNEPVVFSGGISISPTKVVRLDKTPYADEFPAEVMKKIGVLDLSALGIQDYGELHSVGFSRPYASSWMELFVNDNPGRLARWPNDSTVAMGTVLDKGSVPRDGDKSNRGGKFLFDTDRPKTWQRASDVWISGYFNYGYAEDAVKLSHIDTVSRAFWTVQPHVYGYASGKMWNRWYAYNIPEEIDKNGEYYIDRERGLLFFYLPSLVTKIDLSVLKEPFLAIEGAKNITIKGIVFEAARGMGVYMERSESCLISDCVFRNLGSLAVSVGRGIMPFASQVHQGSGEPAGRLLGSLDQHRYENTEFDRLGGHDNRIVNCHIYNTGAGGVSLGGGNRLTLTAANNSLENCRIHDFNRIEKSYRPAVSIEGVGNRISHCEIYNAPSMAFLLHGNDHVLEYCNVYDVCREVDDQGAFYYGRDASERGHQLRFNYFHHLGNANRTSAIYHDDGACGMTVFGNIFYKAGTIPVLIGGGQDISYKNNLFIDCPLGIHIDNRFQNWSKNSLLKGEVIDKRLNAIHFDQPPYVSRYPELANYWKENPAIPKRLVFERNMFVKVKTTRKGEDSWFTWSETNKVSEVYPYNWKMMDSRHFIPDDTQLSTPPDWQTLPVEQIGIMEK